MYNVYDDYDLTMECIGKAENLREVKKIAKERYYDTDGECLIYYGSNRKDIKFLETF